MSAKFSTQSAGVAAENQAGAWLDEAGLAEGVRRAELLRRAGELLLHGAARALPAALERVLCHGNDRAAPVRRQVLAFVEEVSKLHPAQLPAVVGPLRLLVIDGVVAVQKRAIQAASIVYRHALLWLSEHDRHEHDDRDRHEGDMQHVWQHLTELKLIVLNMIDSDNEGIRTHSIKFLEEVVLLQTAGDGGAGTKGELDLARLPPFVDRRALEDEAEHIFALLLKFHNSEHISSVNLMACMSSLCGVARARPRLVPRVLRALRQLAAALPPTLSASQGTSVRKHLRAQLLQLARAPGAAPAAGDALPALLADAGLTPQEVARALPRERRAKRLADLRVADAKRVRLDSPLGGPAGQGSDGSGRDAAATDDEPPPASAPDPRPAAVSEGSLYEGLARVESVVRLVTATLLTRLPPEMPPEFPAAYAPIPDAGGDAQRRRLARLLLTLVQGDRHDAPAVPEPAPDLAPAEPEPPPPPLPPPPPPAVPHVDDKATLKIAVAKLQESSKAEAARLEHLRAEEAARPVGPAPGPPPATPSVPRLKHKVKLLRLQELTRPLPRDVRDRLALAAVRRVLGAERPAESAAEGEARRKLLATFAAGYGPALRALVLEHVLAAPGARLELALAWLYEEYAVMQGFARLPATQPRHDKHDLSYERLLAALAAGLLERGALTATGADEDGALRRLYLEAPLVTDEAAELLRLAADEPRRAPRALALLELLCAQRPPRAHRLAPALLGLALSEHEPTRELALAAAARLHARGAEPAGAPYGRLRAAVEKHALVQLGFVSLSAPPAELPGARGVWTEPLYRACLGLALALLPQNEELVVETARVYGACEADGKRVLLRALEPALRALLQPAARPTSPGAPAPLPAAAAALLADCPRGAETLLTRVVHMLTEQAPPSAELVSRVRELYATRVPDVRFLIPVLCGLSAAEVVAALPQLIKLSAAAVKEVFNKLLGLHAPHAPSPVPPAELLVALHDVPPAQADLKHVIRATALCFAERRVYTAHVLDDVLARLAARPDVPVLMLRSVLQALALHASLAPRVLDVLHALLEKQVWTDKVAWEGWLKCVSRLAPRSCFLLAALPARALRLVPRSLLAALRAHAATLTPAERALLPPHVAAAVDAAPDPAAGPAAPEPDLDPDRPEPPDTQPPRPSAPGTPVEPLPPGMD